MQNQESRARLAGFDQGYDDAQLLIASYPFGFLIISSCMEPEPLQD